MNFKKLFLIIMLVLVLSLSLGSVNAKTEKVKIGSNTKYNLENPYETIVKTTSKNFIITTSLKYKKKMVDQDSPFTGYLTVKSKNPKVKINSIQVKEGNGKKGFKWKTHLINSNNKTIKLGKSTLPNLFENGVKKPPLIYIVKY